MRERRIAATTPFLERLFAGHHDVLAALRSLRRSPGFVAVAVLSLGLAIGLTTTTFAMLNAVERPYMPFERPDQLVLVFASVNGHVTEAANQDITSAWRQPLRRAGQTVLLDGAGNIRANQRAILPKNVIGHMVRGMTVAVGTNFFSMLGVRPLLGRVFNFGDGERPDIHPAVISYRLWSGEYGRTPDLASIDLALGGEAVRVIGVMPPLMNFPEGTDVWAPLDEAWSRGTGGERGGSEAIVRLSDGVQPARLRTQLDAVAAGVATRYRGTDLKFGYKVFPAVKPPAVLSGLQYTMGGAALLVLLIACLNLANLMLARGLARRREIAVRMALGATGAGIVRFVVAECAILAVVGGGLGVMLSLWGVRLAEYRMPSALLDYGFVAPHLSWSVVGVAALATVTSLFIAALGPTLEMRGADVGEAMNDGGSSLTPRRNRIYALLVVGEVGLSLMLAMTSALLTRAAYHEANLQFDFDAGHLLEAQAYAPRKTCPWADSTSTFGNGAVASLAGVPGVRFAAADYHGVPERHLVTSDQPGTPIQRVVYGYQAVSVDYFRTYGYPITAGRDFEAGDANGLGVAIVNWQMAEVLWPFESPVGKALKLGPAKSDAPWVRVVGVSGRRSDWGNELSVARAPDIAIAMRLGCHFQHVVVRTASNASGTPTLVARALRNALPGWRVGSITPFLEDHREAVKSRTFLAELFICLGLFALALACVGVYGVLNYVVGLRMREFATRVALGAQRGHLLAIVVHDAAIMVLAGIGIGAFAAMWFGGFITGGSLNQIDSMDVVALVCAELVVIVVSAGACVAPAVRASRADPVKVLRAT